MSSHRVPASRSREDDAPAVEPTQKRHKNLEGDAVESGGFESRMDKLEKMLQSLMQTTARLVNAAQSQQTTLTNLGQRVDQRIEHANNLNIAQAAASIEMKHELGTKVVTELLQNLYPSKEGENSMSSWLEDWRVHYHLPPNVYPGNLDLKKVQDTVRHLRGRWIETLRMAYYKGLHKLVKQEFTVGAISGQPNFPDELDGVLLFRGEVARVSLYELLQVADLLQLDLSLSAPSSPFNHKLKVVRAHAQHEALAAFIKSACSAFHGLSSSALLEDDNATSCDFRSISVIVYKHFVARNGAGLVDRKRFEQNYVSQALDLMRGRRTQPTLRPTGAGGATGGTERRSGPTLSISSDDETDDHALGSTTTLTTTGSSTATSFATSTTTNSGASSSKGSSRRSSTTRRSSGGGGGKRSGRNRRVPPASI